jgi:PPOX class probable F420-dependent enzyme
MGPEKHWRHDNHGVVEPVAARPGFPASYGIRSDEEGLVAWDDVVARLERARNYWIATTRPDGSPHTMPVWGLWLDGSFVFSSGATARKTRNLAHDPRVVVHLESGDEVVIVEGTAERIADEAELRRIGEIYTAKYDFTFDPTGPGDYPVFRVRPRIAYAWLERDFPGTATRFAFG